MVTSLPAAQEISADTIAALLGDAIANKVRNVGALLQLPEARLLGAKFALDMVPKAVEAGLGGVAVELGRCERVISGQSRMLYASSCLLSCMQRAEPQHSVL